MLKDKIVIGVIALVLLAGLGLVGVKAVERYGTVSIANVENLTMNVEGVVDSVSGVFGASGSRFPNGISADSTSPSAGEVRGTTLTATGAATVGGSLDVSGETAVQGFTQGGGCTASSTTAATELWTEADLLGSNCFEYDGATAAAISITLPATSTMTTLLPNPGDFRRWVYTGYTAAATTTTFVAGAGIDLIAVSNANDVIDGGEYAELSCWRQIDTDVTCIVSELVAAD